MIKEGQLISLLIAITPIIQNNHTKVKNLSILLVIGLQADIHTLKMMEFMIAEVTSSIYLKLLLILPFSGEILFHGTNVNQRLQHYQ
jgi:hypothetical protein